jgi:hypothetical protein
MYEKNVGHCWGLYTGACLYTSVANVKNDLLIQAARMKNNPLIQSGVHEK